MYIYGDQKMTAEQVIDTCTMVPPREQVVKNDTAVNPSWKPISHGSFVQAMHEALEAHELNVIDSSFALNKSGHLLVGGFQVTGDMLPKMPGGVDGNYELLLRHANDMSRGVQVNAGINLMVCTNGCIGGETLAVRKHTSNFDVGSWARDVAIAEFIGDCSNQVEFLDRLRAMDCSDSNAARCILEAGSRGILPLARTVDVWNEWKNPVFSTEDFPLHTAYKLYGDMTHVSQKCSPQRQLQIIQEASPLVMEFCA